MALMNNEYAYFSSFFEKKIKKKNTCVHEKRGTFTEKSA